MSAEKSQANANKGSGITVTQIRSAAGRTVEVKQTLNALGLGRIGKSTTFKSDNAALRGMIQKVEYLLSVKKNS